MFLDKLRYKDGGCSGQRRASRWISPPVNTKFGVQSLLAASCDSSFSSLGRSRTSLFWSARLDAPPSDKTIRAVTAGL